MDRFTPNIRRRKKSYPPLEELIIKIDQQIDKRPHPYATEGFEAFLGSQLSGFGHRGNQYICFYLHNTQFAFPLQHTLEITYRTEITPLPNLPEWVLGICNVRGEIISVVDLSHILGLAQQDSAAGGHLILIHHQDVKTAVIADKIVGTFFDEDPNNNIEKEAPKDRSMAQFVDTVWVSNQENIFLLEVPKLMSAIEVVGI